MQGQTGLLNEAGTPAAYISGKGFTQLLLTSCPISKQKDEDTTFAFLPFLSFFCMVSGGRKSLF